MKSIKVPKGHNYIAAFLTMRCNLDCSYCINAFSKPFSRQYGEMSTNEWIKAINRLDLPKGLPVTLQGGEPTVRKDLIGILKGIRKDIDLDILTNGQFDIDKFIDEIPANRFRQFKDSVGSLSKISSVRISYHPEQMDLEDTVYRILKLKDNGFAASMSVVNHPTISSEVLNAKERCEEEGINFWLKEFLGFYNNELYGTYKYPDAIKPRAESKSVECKTSELLIAPGGHIYRCHKELYRQENPIGHLLDDNFKIKNIFGPCENYGTCNPCDIKLKTNRFLHLGHCSVEIRRENER